MNWVGKCVVLGWEMGWVGMGLIGLGNGLGNVLGWDELGWEMDWEMGWVGME